MSDYIRAQIKYMNSEGSIDELGELSIATWGESEELAEKLAQHFNLPKGEYDLYVMSSPNKALKNLTPDELHTILLVPRYSGPLIKP
jgi:hypothetical protein